VSVRKSTVGFVEALLERSLKPVEHSDTFSVAIVEEKIEFVGDVAFTHGDVEMVNGFQCFAACAVDTFDLVSDMPIAVLLGEVCRRTVG
jgi:hypothetical protein